MRRLTAALLCSVLPSLSVAAGHVERPSAEQYIQDIQGKDARALLLEQIKQLREGVDAWPLILNPASPAEQRVNATLSTLNKRLEKALNDCDGDYDAWLKVVGGDVAVGRDQKTKDWSRRVKVTMHGPRFLSVVASDDVFCGGAHPDESRIAMVFDMSTGTQVDWNDLVSKSKGVAIPHEESAMDGAGMNTLVSPILRAKSVAAAIGDCKDAFQDHQAYLLWPDAKDEVLVAQPDGLPHVVQGCAKEIHLTMEQARKLGFDASLLSAIAQAHRQLEVAPRH